MQKSNELKLSIARPDECRFPMSSSSAADFGYTYYRYTQERKQNKQNQSGRSMIEMLGVLAIIGVLSVGGIAGFSSAMERYKLNKLNEFLTTTTAMTQQLLIKSDNIREEDIQYVFDQQSSYHATAIMCAYDSNNHPVYAIAGLEIAKNICKIMQPAINTNYQYSIRNVFVGMNCEPAPIDCSSEEDLEALQFIWDEEAYAACDGGECPEYVADPFENATTCYYTNGSWSYSNYCLFGCKNDATYACATGCVTYGSETVCMEEWGNWYGCSDGRCQNQAGEECLAGTYDYTRSWNGCPTTCISNRCYFEGTSNNASVDCPLGVNEDKTSCYLPDGVTMNSYGDIFGCNNGICYMGSSSYPAPWGTGPMPDELTMNGYGEIFGCYNGICYQGSNPTMAAPWGTGPMPDGITMSNNGYMYGCDSNGLCIDGSIVYGLSTDGSYYDRYGDRCAGGLNGTRCAPTCIGSRCYPQGTDGVYYDNPWGSTLPDGVTMTAWGLSGCDSNGLCIDGSIVYGLSTDGSYYNRYGDRCAGGLNGTECAPTCIGSRCYYHGTTGEYVDCTSGMDCGGGNGNIYGCSGNYAWHGSYSQYCSRGCTTCYGDDCTTSYVHCK